MRPYLAVIKDSFREALASRVLWILMLLIGLLLAAVAPIGWKPSRPSLITPRDLRRVNEFASRLRRSNLRETDPAVRHIKSMFSDEFVEQLKASDESGIPQRFILMEELNKLIKEKKLYDEQVAAQIDLDDEGKQLADLSSRTPEQEQRLNRLVLEAVFPRHIGSTNDEFLSFTYAGFDVGLPPLPADLVRDGVEQTIVMIVSLVAGTVGVFVGILVTASIIPNTFDSGSLYLLLSKPISRPLLYLSKFAGGCSFVLINATFLIVGIWMLAGLRLGQWNHRLLWCIPIFLFLFAVYYSVSGFAGLVWRNTIVCVAVTIMFWFGCKLVGSSKQIVDLFAHEPNRLIHVVQEDSHRFAITNSGGLKVWDTEMADWWDVVQPGFAPPGAMIDIRTLPPVKDLANDRIVFIRNRNELCTVERRDEEWIVNDYGTFDSAIRKTDRERSGRVVAVGKDLYRISDQLQQQLQAKPHIFGLPLPALTPEKKNFQVVPVFDRTSDSPVQATTTPRKERMFDFDGADCATNEQQDALAIWKTGTVFVATRSSADADSGYNVERKQPFDQLRRGLIETAGNHVLLATDNGEIRLLDFHTLEVENTFRPFGKNQPRFVHVSGDGRFWAVLFHSRQVWLYDVENSVELTRSIPKQESISGCGFGKTNGSLLFFAVDRVHRLNEFSLPDLRVVDRKVGSSSLVEKISWYALDPLSSVFPQPTRFDETISYVVTGKETSESVGVRSLSQNQIKLDPWSPIWTSFGFLIFMLLISCVYFYRQDY